MDQSLSRRALDPVVPAPGLALAGRPTPWWLVPIFAFALLFLCGQLAIKHTRSEPFPTFLLPGGATLYHADAEALVYRRQEFLVVGPDGTETSVPIVELLPGIHPGIHRIIVRDGFGLSRPGPRRPPIRLGPVTIPVTGGVITEEEIRETRAWLRQNAEAAAGHPAAALRIVNRMYRLEPLAPAEDEEVVRVISDRTLTLLPE
ncbi:MAG: hypothetical protein AAGI91_11535 [Bacteroidota bacterium]